MVAKSTDGLTDGAAEHGRLTLRKNFVEQDAAALQIRERREEAFDPDDPRMKKHGRRSPLSSGTQPCSTPSREPRIHESKEVANPLDTLAAQDVRMDSRVEGACDSPGWDTEMPPGATCWPKGHNRWNDDGTTGIMRPGHIDHSRDQRYSRGSDRLSLMGKGARNCSCVKHSDNGMKG